MKTYLSKRADDAARRRKYYRRHKARVIAANSRWQRTEGAAGYRLSNRLRIRLWEAIRGRTKAGSAVRDLGCSIVELRARLESQFQPGMTWDNYGEWHIDHIRPLSSFDLTDREQLLQAVHFSNLQPLWATDNLKKGTKVAT